MNIAKVPTTVEEPYEDVTIGFFNAIKAIEKTQNISIYQNGKWNPNVQIYFTSSAGGGLLVTVVGLTDIYSANIGKKTALGSGAVINKIICGGDGRDGDDKICALNESQPDLILFAAGTDSNQISLVCRMAEFIRRAEVKNKFKKSLTPIIYSGNRYAIPEVEKILQGYPIFFEENVCNSFRYKGINLHKRIQEIFQNHVMRDAPGYWKIHDITNNEVLPTPIAVSQALSLLDKNKNTLLFDIGGATTDVYTMIHGKLFRSVSANIGMSYSILNTLQECGLPNIMRYLKHNQGDVQDYIGHKYLHPTILPDTKIEEEIEASVAINAINKAIENHFLLYQQEFDDVQRESKIWKRIFQKKAFTFDIIIGSGGVISNSRKEIREFIYSHLDANFHLALFDRNFLLPHVGVTCNNASDFAVKLMKESLQKIDNQDITCQKIYRDNLYSPESFFEANPIIVIPTLKKKFHPINLNVNAGDILFEDEEKIYKKYYTSIPQDENDSIDFQAKPGIFKKSDLIIQKKWNGIVNKVYAQFDCELIEINKFQIILSEVRENDVMEDIYLYRKKIDRALKADIQNLIKMKYPEGLVGKKFLFNTPILSDVSHSFFIAAPMSGEITTFNQDDLTVSMKRLTKITSIKTFASGTITKINDDFIFIRSIGTKIKAKFGFGNSQSAKIGKNAMLICNEKDANDYIQNEMKVAIAYNLPFKVYEEIRENKEKSLIIINDFDGFIHNSVFDNVINSLQHIELFCSTATSLKSGVIRPYIYFE